MAEGLKALLEAAQFIEQQEKLKLSPQATAIPAILNDQQHRFIMHAYDATVAAAAAAAASANITNATTMTTTSGHMNGGSINIRNSNVRHAITSSLQVSSSAPAAAATFQHINGHHNLHNNNSSSSKNTTVASPHTTTHAAIQALANGTNNASTTTTTTVNGHQQQLHHNPLHHHPHMNLNHRQQQNGQLINGNNNDYEFNGNASSCLTLVPTSTSSSEATSDNLQQQSALSSRPNDPSQGCISDANSSNKNNDTINNNTSFMLLTNATTTKLLKTASTSSPNRMVTDDEAEPDDVLMETNADAERTANGATMAIFTLIGRNDEIVGNANASKQMLQANSIRITAPTFCIGQTEQAALSKTANIPLNNKNVPNITGFSSQLASTAKTAPNTGGSGGGGGNNKSVILTNRHKTFVPLTPPPMSSRKFVEPTHSRIRSFSLSSHKFSANNHHQLHAQNGNNNSMMVDEMSPTQQHYSTSSQHSPPRHVSTSLSATTGSHYMHMINTASSPQSGLAVSGINHPAHSTPRRRTISSTSNGAGTREVHNKLEKNRRAHLKECYEALKNQLSLKDEDRRKTSNLAILGEALKCVQSYQKRNHELEAEWEHLANEKINLQKRIVSLKRELGPKYEQIFSGIFPDIEVGSIPSERDAANDAHSLSSGRGSTLYSSSSSLSSGGSNGSSSGGNVSNALSSPVGARLQTALPTTITPVINKVDNNSNVNSTSPISINNNSNVVIHQHQRKNPLITTTVQAVAIPTPGGGGGGGVTSPPVTSPTAIVTFGSSLPLSLTAKNISATAITRGSPTPSTPSPSPSSSSGVSSSSSLISSSPPINGVINNGRTGTVNIPNGLKLQAAAAAGAGLNGGTNATSASTILAIAAPAQLNNTNNVLGNQHHQQNGRKKNLTSNNNNNTTNIACEAKNNSQHQQLQQLQHANEDGEQPAKFLKVFNSSLTSVTNGHHHQQQQNQLDVQTNGQKLLLTNNGGILQGGGCSGSGNNKTIDKAVTNSSSSYAAAAPSALASASEMCRLPGGAELNILPSNGLKISSSNAGSIATAFYHANGKITFINGPPVQQHSHQYQYQQPPSSSPLSTTSTTITSNGTTTLTNGILLKDAASVTPLLVSAASSSTAPSLNGLHFTGNFAQLLAAANTTAAGTNTPLSTNGKANASASIVPMAANFQNMVEPKARNNKTSFASWRSGAATTN